MNTGLRTVVGFLMLVCLTALFAATNTPAPAEKKLDPCVWKTIPPKEQLKVKCDRDHPYWPKRCGLKGNI